MNRLHQLWVDETGAVVSAELVLVGTLGVVGATVGLKSVSTAVNEEMLDVASAFRSLDQSYSLPERSAGGAWTAGSSYRQQDVAVSLEELRSSVDAPSDSRSGEPSARESVRHRDDIDRRTPFPDTAAQDDRHPTL